MKPRTLVTIIPFCGFAANLGGFLVWGRKVHMLTSAKQLDEAWQAHAVWTTWFVHFTASAVLSIIYAILFGTLWNR